MGGWIDYWSYTGDKKYNKIVTEAMLAQVGENNDYQPSKQFITLGNDDQAFWGIAAMSAAERGFPDPPEDEPQWLALAQAVFQRQASRWDDETCGGGLRWQVIETNTGYDYKNSISNGLFYQIAARLARYTGNATYAEWAEKTWDWSTEIGIVSDKFEVFDGAHIPKCVVSGTIQWSYNAGIYIGGHANMYQYYTGLGDTANAAKYMNLTEQSVLATDGIFFNYVTDYADPPYPPNVMTEQACEFRTTPDKQPTCNTDQRSFKAYLSRHLAMAYQLVPSATMRDYIMTRFRASAVAAAKSCNGGDDGQTCGIAWGEGTYDGSAYGIAIGGLGEHLAVMELFQNLLVMDAKTLKNENTGTSKGDVNAGTGEGLSAEDLMQTDASDTGDKAGAGILTTICLVALIGLTYWLMRE